MELDLNDKKYEKLKAKTVGLSKRFGNLINENYHVLFWTSRDVLISGTLFSKMHSKNDDDCKCDDGKNKKTNKLVPSYSQHHGLNQFLTFL